MGRWLLACLAAWAVSACDAGFEDLRPEAVKAAQRGGGPVDAAAPAVDAAAGGRADAGAPTGDAGAGRDDVGPRRVDAAPPAEDVVIAEGPWMPTDYPATGTSQLVRLADGGFALRFSDDFSTSAVPGPVVVLSTRAALGSRLDPGAGDLRLGAMSTVRGAQMYRLPEAPGDRRRAFVFCEPFGVEVAHAVLEDVQ